MNNAEKINNKYKDKITSLINNHVHNCFSALSKVEDYFYKDKVKINIESREKVTYQDVTFFFDSLFEADNLESFNLVIDKIIAIIEKYRLKTSLDGINADLNLDYELLENMISNQIFEAINEGVPSSSRISLSAYIDKETSFENEANVDGYIDFDRFEELVDLVLKLLPTLKGVAETYGLVSIQDVEFSRNRYLALEECFEKIEFTKKVTPNIGKMCETLISVKDEDLNDILSDSYAKYTLIVLEATHFVAKFYTAGKNERKAAEKHKNESNRINSILADIEYYLDYIDYSFNYDFVSAYPVVQKIMDEFNQKEFVDKLINELTKKAKRL